MIDHPDAQQDAEMLDPVVKVFEYLADQVKKLEEKVASLESLVVDEIIGGVTKLYKTNMRTKGIEDLKGKYGDVFEPMKGDLEALEVGDIYEKLMDVLEDLQGADGYTDEVGDAKIKEIAGLLKSKFDKIKGIKEEGEAPAAVEVTTVGVTEGEPEAETEAVEADPVDETKAMIERMKKSGFRPDR